MPHPPILAQLLHAALVPRLGRLLELCGVEGWQADPESLHQVRVASRRVRAVLDLVDPEHYPGFQRQRRQLKRLTRALGLTRELDVHALNLAAMKDHHPEILHQAAVEHVLEGLERRNRKARQAMRKDLSAISLAHAERLLAPPGLPGPVVEADLPAAAWACLEPWVRGVEEPMAALLDREDIPALHALRIRVKRLRYTLEILEPVFPAPQADWLERLKALQTALGQHHDFALLEGLLWKVHGGLAERQRITLASGVLDLVGLAAEDRRSHFERFRALGLELRDALLFFHLKQALEGRPGMPG